jgi:hypothetical protein
LLSLSWMVREVVHAESGLEKLLHRPFEAVPAESLAEVFHLHGEGGARLLQPDEVPIVRAARGEVVEDAIVTVRAPGQPVRHLRVNATPMVGPDGERQGAWALMADVTSLVAAARGELSRSMAETVNDHLRTPLTTIPGSGRDVDRSARRVSPGSSSFARSAVAGGSASR